MEPLATYEPNSEEKSMAMIAHILQVVTWWIGPLVVLLVKRDSKFVSYHALQALLLQALLVLAWMVVFAAFIVLMVVSVPSGPQPKNAPPPVEVLIAFPLLWVGMMGGWLLMLVLAVVYGIKAGRGEWAGYPVLRGLARRLLSL